MVSVSLWNSIPPFLETKIGASQVAWEIDAACRLPARCLVYVTRHVMLVHADACRMHVIQLYIQSDKLSAARVLSIRGDFTSFPSSTFVCNLPCKHPHLCAPIDDLHLQGQAGAAFRTKYRLMMKLTSGDDLSCELVIYLNLRPSLNAFFSKTAW